MPPKMLQYEYPPTKEALRRAALEGVKNEWDVDDDTRRALGWASRAFQARDQGLIEGMSSALTFGIADSPAEKVQKALEAGAKPDPKVQEAYLRGGFQGDVAGTALTLPITLTGEALMFKLFGKAGAGLSQVLRNTAAFGRAKAAAKVGELGGEAAHIASKAGKVGSVAEQLPAVLGFRAADAVTTAMLPEGFSEENPMLKMGADIAALTAGQFAVKTIPKILATNAAEMAKRKALNILNNEAGGIAPEMLKSNPLGPAIMKGIEQITEIPLIPTKGPFGGASRALGGNTLKQWFTHPMDRMPKAAGEAFQDTTVSAQRIGQVVGDVGVKIQGLNLAEREGMIKALKAKGDISKLEPDIQQKIAGLINPIRAALNVNKGVLAPTKKMERAYDVGVEKAVRKVFAADVDDPVWQFMVHNYKGDLTTPKGTLKFLEQVISHPSTPETIRTTALDHYNLGAKTGRELTARIKGSYEMLLSRRIMSNPDWVKPTEDFTKAYVDEIMLGNIPKAGKNAKDWVRLPTHREFDDMLVHKTIAEGFNDMDMVPGVGRQLYNAYFLAPWKTMKVLWNPIARARDMFSNVMFNDIAGQHPLSMMNVKQYTKALNAMHRGEASWKAYQRETGGSPGNLMNIDPGPILNAMNYGGGVPGTMLRLMYDPTMFKGKNVIGKYSSSMADIARFTDDWAKFAKYDWNMSHGMGSKEAATDALRTVGDFNRQTPFIKFVRDWGMPFFGWQAHAIKTVGKGLIHHPVRTAKYFALPLTVGMYATEQLNISDQEWERFKVALPEYVTREAFGMPTAVPLPYRDALGRIQFMDIGWWLPGLQDIAEIGHSATSPVGFVQNPAFTLAASLKANKKFSGAPIYYEWEPTDVKAMKTMQYIYQQLMPSFAPGGGVWDKVGSALSEDPERPTLDQAVGPLMGWRVRGYDPNQTISKHHAILDAQTTQAEAAFGREVRQKTGDLEGQEKTREKFREIMMDIERRRREGR